MSLSAKLFRYSDLSFANNYRTKYESSKIEGLGPSVGGYLVWRRTLILPCTALLCVAFVIQCVLVVGTYFQGYRGFIRNFVGEAIWTNVFCPDETKPCKAADGFIGVYYVLMISDIILCLVAGAACVLLVISTRTWPNFRSSARYLRRAYGMLFTAPFVLLLVFAPAQFVNVGQTQQLLCAERAGDLVPPGAGINAASIKSICDKPIEQWDTALNSTLSSQGRLRDPKTGSCSYAQGELAKATTAFASSGKPCVDVPAATIAAAAKGMPLKDCSQISALGLCTFHDTNVRTGVLTACPLACGICSVKTECYDNDAKFIEMGSPNNVTSCASANALGWCTHPKAKVKQAVTEACPLTCGSCTGPCEDRDAAFDLQGNPQGLTTCADATTFGNRGNINLCTAASFPQLYNLVRTICPSTCNLCGAAGRRLSGTDGELTAAEEASHPAERRALQASNSLATALQAGDVSGSERLKLDGCIDPLAVTAVGVLEVTLSDEVVVGAIALRRGATVLLTLLPASLGLAMGAGAGATQAKTLLAHSRMPARLANIIVVTSLIFVAAILGIVNQLLASAWGTLFCLSILGALAVWLPVGLGVGSVPSLSAIGASIVHPASADNVVAAVTRRKYLVQALMILAVLFLACFLGLSSAVSMVTQQLTELQRDMQATMTAGKRRGNWGPFIQIVLSILQTLLELIAKTYLAQAFYTDSGVVAVTLMWHNDRADSAEEAEKRSEELAEVAYALGKDATTRQITERPRTRKLDSTKADVEEAMQAEA